MASLGEISVALVADTSKFDAGIKRASGAASGAAKELKALGGAALGVVAGLGALAVGTAKLMSDLAGAGDAAAKAASRMGVTAEAVQELGYAAELSGSNVETVEKAFIRLSKNANDAANGIGTGKDAFDRLGISVKDTNGNLKGSEQLFSESADALSKLGSDTERAALAQDIFGKSGAKLLPMLKGGADGMAEMRKEAQELGFVISNETAARSEQFNDNMLRLNKTMEGVTVTILSNLMPSFNEMSKTAVQIAKDFTSTGDSTTTMKTGINNLADAVKAAAPAMAVLGGAIGFLVDLVKTAYVAMGGFALALHAASTAGAYLDAQLADTEEGWARYEKKLKELTTASDRLDKTTQSLGDTTMSGVEFGDKMAEALKKMADAAKRGAEELTTFVGPTMDQAGLSAQDLADRTGNAGDAFDKAKKKGKSFADTLLEIETAARRASAATDEVIMAEVDFINRPTVDYGKVQDDGPLPGMIDGVDGRTQGNRGGTASGEIDAITGPLADSFMNVGTSADAMSSVIGGLTGGMGNIITLFADMWQQSEGFTKIMERVNGLLEPFQAFIDDIASTAFDALEPVFDILDALAPVIKLVLGAMNPLILPLKLVAAAFAAAEPLISGFVEGLRVIGNAIEGLLGGIGKLFKKQEKDVQEVERLWGAAAEAQKEAAENILRMLQEAGLVSSQFVADALFARDTSSGYVERQHSNVSQSPSLATFDYLPATSSLGSFTDAVKEATESLTNVPTIFRANLRRTQAEGGLTADRGGWAGAVAAQGGGGMNFYGPVSVNSDTPKQFADAMQRGAFIRTGSRGASEATNLVFGLASAG